MTSRRRKHLTITLSDEARAKLEHDASGPLSRHIEKLILAYVFKPVTVEFMLDLEKRLAEKTRDFLAKKRHLARPIKKEDT